MNILIIINEMNYDCLQHIFQYVDITTLFRGIRQVNRNCELIADDVYDRHFARKVIKIQRMWRRAIEYRIVKKYCEESRKTSYSGFTFPIFEFRNMLPPNVETDAFGDFDLITNNPGFAGLPNEEMKKLRSIIGFTVEQELFVIYLLLLKSNLNIQYNIMSYDIKDNILFNNIRFLYRYNIGTNDEIIEIDD